ncbi:2-keto-4-pentenoate hydratase/2-oxohepta-3-ene-1,7-dioic acid hydratase (catechol pathway) [Peptoclostridium litorale DSM 5388]|uniref:Ureidoglycolate lyase n=1 Tax=Peptoclostridium litorale DSM 5388 TaxID=1121324 RepID=A0A069RBN1_PEPLI|nr:fumarylacetoacetate hydrolase family protein [Peptoclostridium litorale]KDR94489.1 ureidoglycolate lyase [Peptoclostridium litorale DSM 5388]SIO35834.1 2-keto-4-pentenoate hydratase/2-oxohepta-3-ene-1,7-dioic acid hydratase (catechol pathway) [Peptoclostridium litorale DSM 5388]
MYFATFEFKGEQRLGAFLNMGEGIIPIEKVFEEIGMQPPKDMNELIDSVDDKTIEVMRAAIEEKGLQKFALRNEDVKLDAPIPHPRRNIICLGKNYHEHAKEIEGTDVDKGNELPSHPIYFSKIADPAIGDGAYIVFDENVTREVDYEVELAVIIGRDGIDIKKGDVQEHIFGYTIVNDISARDLQAGHKQWFRGKSLSTFCPMGPYILHKSAVDYPVELDIKCAVNGEQRQNANTRDLIFDIDYVISDISRSMYLRSGDIIITGTPSGVGLGFKPFKYLRSGDVVKCEIENIGTLTNTVATV